MVSKIRVSFVALAAVIALAGCSAPSPGSTKSAPSPGSTKEGSAACGSGKIKIGMVDGYSNSFLKIAEAEVRRAVADCSNVTVDYVTANGSADSFNAAINSFSAQGYKAIITNDALGDQVVGSIKAAYDAGVVVVPYINVPSGTPGKDFTSSVSINLDAETKQWAEWLNHTLRGKGQIIFLGGPAGNPASLAALKGLKGHLKDIAPGITFLVDKPVTTGWDPAEGQKAMAGLIAKFPKIDAIVTDYGGATLGPVRAFQRANVAVPPIATTALNNEFGCAVADIKKTSPNFELMSVDGVVRISAVAVRVALDAIKNSSKSVPATAYSDFVIWDTKAGNAPKCDAALPPGADLSSDLSPEELAAVFK